MRKLILLVLALLLPALALAEDEHFTVLLLGIDDFGKSVTAAEDLSRSDAILLFDANMTTGETRMVSIDRDYAATLRGVPSKISLASYLGGAPLTLKTVNDMFDLNVQYYAAVDIAGMKKVVDVLGGVDVQVLESELDILKNGTRRVYSKAGTYHMDGKRAVEFMRDRQTDSDTGRNARQRRVLSACFKRLTSLGSSKLFSCYDTMITIIRTNLTSNQFNNLIFAVLSKPVKMPLEMRSPKYESSYTFAGEHHVVVADDMPREIAAIKEFLYGQ